MNGPLAYLLVLLPAYSFAIGTASCWILDSVCGPIYIVADMSSPLGLTDGYH